MCVVVPQNMNTNMAKVGSEEFDNNILSILDFPTDSFEDDCFIADWDATNSSHYLGPIPPDVLVDPGPPVLPPPIDAIPELKQQSSYLPEDAGRSFIIHSGNIPVIKPCTSKRARSKRASPSGLSPWLSMLPLFPAARKDCSAGRNRERRRKVPQMLVEEDSPDKAMNPFQDVTKRCAKAMNPFQDVAKRCAHCEVTKTPQWREGPTGPKTLCNACGVRYRSGRLLPEYRPAASPTFVPSLHSNSHRKVLEMRTKAIKQLGTKVEQPFLLPEMEFVPMSSYLFDDPMC